jgi:RNase H-like domain found in reverse transcriptase
MQLKQRVTKAPVLAHFDQSKKIVAKFDNLDYVAEGVLSQLDDDEKLHLITFFLKNLAPAEYNYEIYDKKLLAIIRGFKT